jgi:hypothetical protein
LHARAEYYGSPRYDFVAIRGPDAGGEAAGWFGRLLLLFDAQAVGTGVTRTLALLQWLTHDEHDKFVPDVATLKYHRSVDVIDVESVLSRVRLVSVPDRPLDSARFLLLSYGRANRVFRDEWGEDLRA